MRREYFGRLESEVAVFYVREQLSAKCDVPDRAIVVGNPGSWDMMP